jgi:hypothetical protein
MKKRKIVEHNRENIIYELDGYTLSKLIKWANEKLEAYKDFPKEPELNVDYDCDSTRLELVTYRYETEREYNKRITKENYDKAQAAKNKMLIEERERKIYEDLKKKFEGKENVARNKTSNSNP